LTFHLLDGVVRALFDMFRNTEFQVSHHILPKYRLDELAKEMIALLDQWRGKWIGWIKVHKLLLEGKPVWPERSAAYLNMSQEEVAALIEGAELDKDGKVVGFGLSIVPTPHSYQINGHQFYVWCALDAIMFPLLHQSTVVIESTDPISGEKIKLASTPESVQDVSPQTTVVSWVPGIYSPEDIRSNFYDFTHFFASETTASEHATKHPGLAILPVKEAFRIGELMWNREPYKSIIKDF
jgi:alkylmercury lyase